MYLQLDWIARAWVVVERECFASLTRTKRVSKVIRRI